MREVTPTVIAVIRVGINSKDYVAESGRDMKVNGVYGRSTGEKGEWQEWQADHHTPFLFR